MKKEQFRNWLHVLGGLIIGLILSLTFDGVIIPAQIILTIMWIGIPSTMWEWGWNMYNGSKIDYVDVVRAVLAGLVVVIISNFLK
jgi:hypothetical protein